MLPSLLISLSLSFRRVVTFTWHFVLHLTLTFLRLFLVFIQHAENSIRRNLIFIRVLAGMLGERAPKGICARVLPSSVIHQRHIYVREFPFATQPFFLGLCVCVCDINEIVIRNDLKLYNTNILLNIFYLKARAKKKPKIMAKNRSAAEHFKFVFLSFRNKII